MNNPPTITRLLVSVRDPQEAALAMGAGADVIDVKEPSFGSLGAARAETIQAVIDLVANRRSTSAALGELIEWDGRGIDVRGLSYAKIGLAGCAERGDWQISWRAWAKSLPNGTLPVAVAYADWHAARAPAWREVVSLAARGAALYVLADTFDKEGGSLLVRWPAEELAEFVAVARRAGLGVVLAGSLTAADIDEVLDCGPHCIAVRGAVCSGNREGTLDPQKIVELRQAIAR